MPRPRRQATGSVAAIEAALGWLRAEQIRVTAKQIVRLVTALGSAMDENHAPTAPPSRVTTPPTPAAPAPVRRRPGRPPRARATAVTFPPEAPPDAERYGWQTLRRIVNPITCMLCQRTAQPGTEATGWRFKLVRRTDGQRGSMAQYQCGDHAHESVTDGTL